MHAIKKIEKYIAGGMAILSALLLATIVGLFVFEVFMRYALSSPTRWSSDFIGFMMPVMIFFALPEITRRNQHITITFLIDALPPEKLAIWHRIMAFISAIVSVFTAWIMMAVAIKQFDKGIMTNSIIQIPKWIIVFSIAFSFFMVTIIFLITAFTERDE